MSPLKSNKYFLLSLPLILFNLVSFQSVPDLCQPLDKSILLRIKTFWGNPASLAYWDPNIDCCQWEYLQCDQQGHVATLRISLANDIHGPLPPFLDEFPFVTFIQFDNMYNLSGPVPSSIGKITNLSALVLLGTNIGGPIPTFLSQLKNLDQLVLSGNKHTGQIPDFLGHLKSLSTLDLSSNNLKGRIPSALTQLTNLTTIRLTLNKLSGPIPDFTTQQMSELNSLELGFNLLSGSIPNYLGSLPSLITLSIDHNKLTGDASDLFVKNNTVLKLISLSHNSLKFDFSKVELPRLWMLDISHNMIYGSLPISFGLLDPDTVDVSYNRLCGPIPNGRRFKQANPDIFAQNKCLCGGPLAACQ